MTSAQGSAGAQQQLQTPAPAPAPEDESEENEADSHFNSGFPGATQMIGKSIGDAVASVHNSSSDAVNDLADAISDGSEAVASLVEDWTDDHSDGMKNAVDGVVDILGGAFTNFAGIAGHKSRVGAEEAVDNTAKTIQNLIDTLSDTNNNIVRGFVDMVNGWHGLGGSVSKFLKDSGSSSSNVINTVSNILARLQHSSANTRASVTDNAGDLLSLLPKALGDVLSDVASATNGDTSADYIENAADSLEKLFHSNVIGNWIRAIDGARTVTVYDDEDYSDPEILILSQDEATREGELAELAKVGNLTHTTENGWTLVTNTGDAQGSGDKHDKHRSASQSASFSEDSNNGLSVNMRNIFEGLFRPLNRRTSSHGTDRTEGSRSSRRQTSSKNRKHRNRSTGGRSRSSTRYNLSSGQQQQQQQQQQRYGGRVQFSGGLGAGRQQAQQQQQQRSSQTHNASPVHIKTETIPYGQARLSANAQYPFQNAGKQQQQQQQQAGSNNQQQQQQQQQQQASGAKPLQVKFSPKQQQQSAVTESSSAGGMQASASLSSGKQGSQQSAQQQQGAASGTQQSGNGQQQQQQGSGISASMGSDSFSLGFGEPRSQQKQNGNTGGSLLSSLISLGGGGGGGGGSSNNQQQQQQQQNGGGSGISLSVGGNQQNSGW